MKNTKDVAVGEFVKKAITQRYNISALKNYQRVFNLPDIYIDNKKLDGFLEHFVDSYSCDKCVCDMSDGKTEGKSLKCSYCKSWSEKAVSYNEQEIIDWKDNADRVLESMVDSEIYG